MDSFDKSTVVRLLNHHLNKCLYAHEDEKSVILQERQPPASFEYARWTVECDRARNTIRLKSFHGTYLTASDVTRCCLGVQKKVIQTEVGDQGYHRDSSVDWEPVAAEGYLGKLVKLRTQDGNFLRANRGIVPWCDSVSHNVPRQEPTEGSILWDIQWLDIITSKSPEARN